MLDLHLHLWTHQPGTPVPTFAQLECYCERAAARGITQIAITEHSYRFERIVREVLPHWQRPIEGSLADATAHVLRSEGGGDLDAYVSALLEAQDAGLPILIGLEVDYLPGAMAAMKALVADYPFDILLGPVHWLDDWLFDAYDHAVFGTVWHNRDVDEIYGQYVDGVLDMGASGIADVVAHADLIKVAGHRPPHLSVHGLRLAQGLADTNVVVEFSSAGLRKPGAETYPRPDLLDELVARGVPFTTASDGHTLDQVGMDFDHLVRELDLRGVTELTSFDRRRRLVYPR